MSEVVFISHFLDGNRRNEMNNRRTIQKNPPNRNRRKEMKRQVLAIAIIILVSGLLLGACGNEPSGPGPQGPVGPQKPVGPKGAVGPQSIEGTPPDNVTVIENSGNLITQEYDYGGFDALFIGFGFDVELRQGDTYRVFIEVEENAMPYVQVVVEGNTLKLDLDDSKTYHMENITLRAEITMPTLTSAVLELGSSLRGEVEAGDIHIEASMSSEVTLTGLAQDVTIDAKMNSMVNLAGLRVSNADVRAEGGSTVTVNPAGRLDAHASMDAEVYYLGSPTLGNITTENGGFVAQK
jgi:hypothetical protein